MFRIIERMPFGWVYASKSQFYSITEAQKEIDKLGNSGQIKIVHNQYMNWFFETEENMIKLERRDDQGGTTDDTPA